jgi:hypothetical protein
MECDKDILVKREFKSRENIGTAKRSWQKLGRQIRGHLKPHTLQKSNLTAVEVSGATDESWSRIDTKEQVEALLIDCNIEQFVKLLPLLHPPCTPARTHGQVQAPREPPN